MRIFQYTLCIVFLLFLLSACGHTGQGGTSLSENGAANIGESSSVSAADGENIRLSLDENTQVDAEVSIPESLQDLKMNLVKAHRPMMKEADIQKLFATEMDVDRKVMDKGYKSR